MNKTRKPQELSRPCARCGPVSRSRLQTLHRKSRLTRKKSYLKSRAGYCILPALGDRHCWGLLLVGKAQSVALSSPVSTQCVTIDTMDLDKDMDSQEVVAMLEECRQATLAGPAEVSEDVEEQCQRCQGSLPADLRTLLQEAGEMKWPFVPEKWQYKQSVSPEDKTDLKDLISKNLPKLLNYLKAAIVAGDSVSALSAAFLIDRFLYWVDASHKLLQIAKALHKRYPTTPVAPQLVIRQARLSVNTGKLQKAEFILSSLINNSGATGCWVYQQESDRTLVQAVSIQIRGQILQKLGLWREAAELVWASLIGFCALPQPDKKGIGTSLGMLANILASMNDQEYEAFKTSPHVDFSCLKEQGHRLLSAAEAARRAVVCSRFSPLFVLTNAVIQGTCLLSYGLSEDCPPAERRAFLGRAKEAFGIGLLTKTEDDPVASRQELHMFVKAAFCLAAAHRWLGLGEEAAARAERTCREAMGLLYAYASGRGREKDRLSQGIMGLVGGAKAALGVAGFPKSDGKSYVPDSYLVREEDLFRVRPDGFHGVVRRYAQYHASVCEAFQSPCGHPRTGTGGSGGACITALKTATEALETECGPWGRRGGAEARRREFARTRGCGHGAGSPAGDGGSSGSSSWHVVSGTGSSGGWEDLGDEARGPAGREGRDAGTLARGDGDGGHGGPGSGPDWGASAMRELRLDGPGDGLDPVQPARMTTAAAGTGSPESAADSARPGAAGTFPFGADGQTFAAKGSGGVPACREDAETEDPSLGETDDVSPPPPLPVVSPSERPDHVPFHGAADSRLQDFYDMDTEAETADDLMDPPVAATGDGVRRPRIYSPEDCASTRRALMPRGVPACREDAETEDPSLGGTDDVSPPPPLPAVSPSERPDHVPFDGAAGSRPRDFYDMDTEAETADDLMDPPVAVARDGVRRPRISSKAGAEPHRRPGYSGSPPSPGTGSSFEMMESDTAGRFRSPDPQGGVRASRKSAEAPDSAGGDRAGSRSALVPAGSTEEQRFFGEVTEEGGGEDGEGDEQLALPLSVSHSSASSGRSFFWSSQYSSSFSDVGSPSLLSSSGDSFVLVPGLTRVEVLKERTLSEDDYRRLLSGVGHTWLLNRLKYTGVFKPKRLRGTHNALLLKYSKVSDSWSARETQVHIGASTGKKGKQRSAFWVQFLHQEEVLGSYVGKEYQSEKELRYHLNDVERQMTAQYYVTEFNKKLYEKQIPMQIYFIPSEVLLILEDRLIKGCVSVEPYMLGDFVKLTNNKKTVVRDYRATDYGIAFGHFTFEFSGHTEIVVDLQGWVMGNGKGLTYLTDPQIHSLKKPKSSSNFYRQGIEYFLQDQHGADCNEICQMLSLGKLPGM